LQIRPPEQDAPSPTQIPLLSQQPAHVAPLQVPPLVVQGAPAPPLHIPPLGQAEPGLTHPAFGSQHPSQPELHVIPPLLPPPPASPWPIVASGMSVVPSTEPPDEPPEDPLTEPEEPPACPPGWYGCRSLGCTTIDWHPTLSLHAWLALVHVTPTQLCARKMSSSRTRSVGTRTCATLVTTGVPPSFAVTVMRAFWSELGPAAMLSDVGRGLAEVG
jgi:hypothetical protein